MTYWKKTVLSVSSHQIAVLFYYLLCLFVCLLPSFFLPLNNAHHLKLCTHDSPTAVMYIYQTVHDDNYIEWHFALIEVILLSEVADFLCIFVALSITRKILDSYNVFKKMKALLMLMSHHTKTTSKIELFPLIKDLSIHSPLQQA